VDSRTPRPRRPNPREECGTRPRARLAAPVGTGLMGLRAWRSGGSNASITAVVKDGATIAVALVAYA